MREKTVAALLMAVLVGGCTAGAEAPPLPPPTAPSGGDFLPAYLQMLRGERPWPTTNHPRDPDELLLPEDAPGVSAPGAP